MEIVSITCGLQLFGVIICWINYFKVKKIEKQILYYHEKKSFQDIYKMGGMWGILTAVINWCIGLIFYICKEVYKEIVFVIIEKAFIIAISGMMMAIIVYMITEIKHLSPEDTIGRKIINSNNKELEEKACRFYKSEFVERFPELSLFYRLFSPLNSEMICIFPYFCPYAESAREIREIFS